MAPLGLHAGDENDAKEFGRGSSQRRPQLRTIAKAAAEFILVLISNLPLGRSRLGGHSPARHCSQANKIDPDQTLIQRRGQGLPADISQVLGIYVSRLMGVVWKNASVAFKGCI